MTQSQHLVFFRAVGTGIGIYGFAGVWTTRLHMQPPGRDLQLLLPIDGFLSEVPSCRQTPLHTGLQTPSWKQRVVPGARRRTLSAISEVPVGIWHAGVCLPEHLLPAQRESLCSWRGTVVPQEAVSLR